MDENISNECNDSGISAALQFARATTEPKILTIDFEGNQEQVLLTTGEDGAAHIATARDLFADRAARPIRRKGTIVVHDLASFIAATNRDSGDNSVIFADAITRKLTAILDFHLAGGEGPRWAQDRIEYGFTLSEQLTAWMRAAAAPMDQRTFARLIDDRLGDIGEGPHAPGSLAAEFTKRRGISFASVSDLVVFTRTIAAKSATESEEQVDENTGDISIQYKKRGDVKTPDGNPIRVPHAFAVKIPVFRGLEATEYNIAVRLRYDIGEKGIAWRIELHALDKYLLAAVEEAVTIVRGGANATNGSPVPGCGLPVFMGTPPAA